MNVQVSSVTVTLVEAAEGWKITLVGSETVNIVVRPGKLTTVSIPLVRKTELELSLGM